jgi:hypothetical protein
MLISKNDRRVGSLMFYDRKVTFRVYDTRGALSGTGCNVEEQKRSGIYGGVPLIPSLTHCSYVLV